MKNILKTLLFVFLLTNVSCSDDSENIGKENFTIKYFQTTAEGNEKFGYTYFLLVTVHSKGNKPAKGHVEFRTNDYGTLISSTKELKYNSRDNIMINDFSVEIKLDEKVEKISYAATFVK